MNENIKKITNLSPLKKINLNSLVKNIEKDKKHSRQYYRFILTKGVGEMMIYQISKKTNLKKILKEYFRNNAS